MLALAAAVGISLLHATTRALIPGDEPPQELLPFVLAGYDVLDFAIGDLDADGRPDAILVLKKPDEAERRDEEESPRPLLLLIRQADGKLQQARRNDRIVYCDDCGGMMGDPYQGIEIAKGSFTVTHYGGSAWRWMSSYAFAYDAAKKEWFLDREGSESFNVNTEGSESKLTIKREELGDLPIERFDFDGGPKQEKKWRVVAARARFYDNPDLKSAPRRAYLVKGDLVEVDRELRNFVRGSFKNGKGDSTWGFLLKKDLEPLPKAP